MDNKLDEILARLGAMERRLDERLEKVESAISFLSDRIEKVETKVDSLTVKTDRVTMIACELARKLLAPVELRALGIPVSGCGSSESADPPLPRAARSHE